MLATVLGIGLLFLSDLCACQFTPSAGGHSEDSVHRYTRSLAGKGSGEGITASNRNKLAIIILVTEFDRKDRDRLDVLHTSLTLVKRNLLRTTPSKVYLFTFEDQIGMMMERLGDLMQSDLTVLPVINSTWVVPHMARDRRHWHSSKSPSYRLMGDWRLSFMPQFARSMGHRYVMQLDDDSYILGPAGGNLVRLFDSEGYVLGARNMQRDPVLVTWGLPELARFYLTTSKVVPHTLFEFCDPPSMEGLYSEFRRSKLEEEDMPKEHLERLDKLGLRTRGGWNRTILHGNCLMYSLDWFFSSNVYHFVQLCRASGGSFAFRWNEQGVMAMLWQIFVPKRKFLHFKFDYAHRINASLALQLAAKHNTSTAVGGSARR